MKGKKLQNKIKNKGKKKPPNPTGKGGFQQGNSGNTRGRPKLTEEEKAVREATKNQIVSTFHWAANLASKGQKINTSELSLFQKGILKSVQMFSITGNYDYIKFPLDHIIGKAPESIKLDSTGGGVTLVISTDYVPKFGNDGSDKPVEPSQSKS